MTLRPSSPPSSRRPSSRTGTSTRTSSRTATAPTRRSACAACITPPRSAPRPSRTPPPTAIPGRRPLRRGRAHGGARQADALYRQIQEIVVQELPYLWLVETLSTRAWSARCAGFKAVDGTLRGGGVLQAVETCAHSGEPALPAPAARAGAAGRGRPPPGDVPPHPPRAGRPGRRAGRRARRRRILRVHPGSSSGWTAHCPNSSRVYARNVVGGDLGASFVHGRPWRVIGERLPATVCSCPPRSSIEHRRHRPRHARRAPRARVR